MRGQIYSGHCFKKLKYLKNATFQKIPTTQSRITSAVRGAYSQL